MANRTHQGTVLHTVKAELIAPREALVKKTDLEEKFVNKLIGIIKSEYGR